MIPKVTAFILQNRSGGKPKILVHEFITLPHAAWRLLGGGIDEGETAVQALWRELEEEAGLTEKELQLVRPLSVQTYYKKYISSWVKRHDFLLVPIVELPESWEYTVQGEGEDAQDLYRLHWLSPSQIDNIDKEHGRYLTTDYLPEFFL